MPTYTTISTVYYRYALQMDIFIFLNDIRKTTVEKNDFVLLWRCIYGYGPNSYYIGIRELDGWTCIIWKRCIPCPV